MESTVAKVAIALDNVAELVHLFAIVSKYLVGRIIASVLPRHHFYAHLRHGNINIGTVFIAAGIALGTRSWVKLQPSIFGIGAVFPYADRAKRCVDVHVFRLPVCISPLTGMDRAAGQDQ